jgi:PucR C-terminal helix-turn-helix domain
MVLAQILDGSIDAITEELDRILAYSLGDTHLAAVMETPGISPPRTDIARLRDAADARGTLLAQHTARARGWYGLGAREASGRRTCRACDVRSSRPGSRSRSENPQTAWRDCGEPGSMHSRRSACNTLWASTGAVACGRTRCAWRRCCWATSSARDFLTDELGPLLAGDSFARRLRETLLAWLMMGSHGSAAAMLGVHENTVRNRLRAAQELLGVPLTGRRTELMVALRLERLLSSAAGEGGAS